MAHSSTGCHALHRLVVVVVVGGSPEVAVAVIVIVIVTLTLTLKLTFTLSPYQVLPKRCIVLRSTYVPISVLAYHAAVGAAS